MKYKKLEYKVKRNLYEFECYDLNCIENDYGLKKKYRVGKFLSLLYKKKIRIRGYSDGDRYLVKGFVYVSIKELEGIVGLLYYKDVLKKLKKDDIIDYERGKSNTFDSNKKLWFVRLNDKFFESNKKLVTIEDGVLNRFLDKESKKIEESFLKKNDDYVLYEKYCCLNSSIKISELDSVIDKRYNNKLNEIRDKLNWSWISNKERKKLESIISDVGSWELKYKNELKNSYELLVNDLDDLRKSNFLDFGENRFKRDGYGKRLYNIYSNIIREFREFIKIDNEEVVELDIKSCFISLFYVFIKQLNSDVDDDFIIDIKKKLKVELKDEFDNCNGLDFVDKFDSIFKNDSVFWSDENEIEFNDYYDYLRLSYGVDYYNEMSRNSFKELVFRLLFSKEVDLKDFKVGNENIDKIQSRFFGLSGKKLMYWLRRIYLNNHIKRENGGKKKLYVFHHNISLILMILENRVMDILRYELMNKDIKYISVFDSLLVKKSEVKMVLKMCNQLLSSIDKSLMLRFKSDMDYKSIIEM
jgi:hypothetical protein